MKTFFPLITLLVTLLEVQTHTCAFHQYRHSSHYRSKPVQPKHFFNQFIQDKENNSHHGRLLYGAGRSAMRITVNTDDFDTLKAPVNTEPQTTMANLNFVKKAMMVAKKFFQNRLKVSTQASIPITDPCYDIHPPATDVTNGIAASDLHIYASYKTDSQTGYGATGVSCGWNTPTPNNVDTTLKAGRPTSGRIIFNTFKLVDSKTLTNRLFSSITATAIHETIHILGFDPSLYSTYLDSNTGLPYANVVQTVSLNTSRTGGAHSLMITPNVAAWALAHFGCNTVTGMPLQNQDGTGVGAHWERTSIYDELMTGTDMGAQKPFTALTFAILKDMGWYAVDDTFNDTTNYGYQKGCSFLKNACYSSTSYPKYFCNMGDYVNVSECTSTFTGKATCSNEAALMADGCSMFKDFFYCTDPASVGDFYQQYTLQSFGTSSFCFKGTISNAGISNTYRGRCYPFSCNYATSTVTFSIGPYTVNCFSNEQGLNKTVTGLQGNVECPIFADVCTIGRKVCPNWCSGNGFCTGGICNCYSDATVVYSGQDCSITTCTAANSYYYAPTSSCLPVCPSGYYANARSKACLPCDSSCTECRDQAKICTSCISTPANPQYFFAANNTCVSQCPSNTYLLVDTCILCDATTAGCLTCSGSPTTCTSCVNPAHYLNQFGNCGTTCTNPYDLYDEISKKCRQTCPNTLYLNNGRCITCQPNYKVVDVLSNVCVGSCTSGYYTDSVNYLCGLCNETCRECDGPYSENCTSCKPNSPLKFQHLKMCVGTCPDGFYADTVNGKCEKCLVNLFCFTCEIVSSAVRCKTCKYGYYLQPDFSCGTSCGPTYYMNRWNHTCDPCHADCRDCSGPYDSSCLNCVNPKYYLKNSTGGYCLSTCPPTGYVTFLSITCLACHSTCQTCINQTSFGCVTCANDLYLESNKCRYVCSPMKYADTATKSCLQCDTKCKYCFGSTSNNCTQCQSGFVLDNFTCTTSCPTGQTANNYSVCEKTTFEDIMKLGLIAVIILVFSL